MNATGPRNPAVTPGVWLLLFVLVVLRFAHWGAPLTEDEAYMIRFYAKEPASWITTHFETPNNHVLLSLLLHGLNALSPKELFESLRHPGPLQLISILPSAGALILLHRTVSASFPARTALLACAALGLSYWHLLYSHMLRGYALSAFLLLVNVCLLQEAVARDRRRLLIFLPPFLAAFNYTVASNLYFSAGLSLGLAGAWVGLRRGRPASFLPILSVAAIAAPLAAMTAQGIVPPFARYFIPLLSACTKRPRPLPCSKAWICAGCSPMWRAAPGTSTTSSSSIPPRRPTPPWGGRTGTTTPPRPGSKPRSAPWQARRRPTSCTKSISSPPPTHPPRGRPWNAAASTRSCSSAWRLSRSMAGWAFSA